MANSSRLGGINGLGVALLPDRFHLVEAFRTGQARVTRPARQRPEAFRRLHLPALETKSLWIVVHTALTCGYADRRENAVLIPDNKQ